MRILHVVPTYLPATRYGGPIRSVHGLCKALVAHGHEVHVYTSNLDGAGRLDVPEGEPVNMDGVRIWYFRCRWVALCWLPDMTRALKTTMAGFDVVHLHSVFLWPMAKAARLASFYRVPYIVSPRGMLVPSLIARRSGLAKRVWIRLVERRTLSRAFGIHVTSTTEADDLAACELALAPVSLIANGIDTPSGALRIPVRGQWLYLGRLSWKKNLHALIDAVAAIHSITLILAGPDDEGIAADLLSRASYAGCSARVRWIGEVGEVDKEALLSASECLILPSFNENFGNTVVEAMSAACPVLVTPRVGARQIVEASGCGMVAKSSSALALADAIREMTRDPDELARRGQSGRKYAIEHLSWNGIATQMLAIYRPRAI